MTKVATISVIRTESGSPMIDALNALRGHARRFRLIPIPRHPTSNVSGGRDQAYFWKANNVILDLSRMVSNIDRINLTTRIISQDQCKPIIVDREGCDDAGGHHEDDIAARAEDLANEERWVVPF